MDIQEPILQAETNLSAKSEEELLEIYNNAEEDSEELKQAKEELTLRGYEFQTQEEIDEIEAVKADALAKTILPVEHYSKTGTLIWELLFLVLSLAGAIYFLLTMQNNGVKITPRLGLSTAVIVLFFSTTGIFVGAIRRLANLKVNPAATASAIVYYVLCFLWSVCLVGAAYYVVKNFSEVVKYSFEYALVSALMPLIGALVSMAYAVIFFMLGKELGSKA
jgi:hypothetical protein